MKTSVPPESFRIAALGWWFLVHVAETVDAMRAAMREYVDGCHPDQLACVVSVRGNGDLESCAGFVFVPRTHLGAGLVAHELAHAAFRVCDLQGLRVEHWQRGDAYESTHATEETYCAIVEALSREFWANAYARGYA